MKVPPVPMQRTSMLAVPRTPITPPPPSSNVAGIVTKFNKDLNLKLMKSASMISTTSNSSHSTVATTGCSDKVEPEIVADSQIDQKLPHFSSVSTSSKDSSSNYSQTLPHKTKSQNSGLAKLEKIYQTIYSGTLRRNKSQRKERPEDLPGTTKEDNVDRQEEPVVVKKRALKYRHSCANQDEAIYVAAKKVGAKKRKERNRRQYHSMNETIEVLADQVVEDDAQVRVDSYF